MRRSLAPLLLTVALAGCLAERPADTAGAGPGPVVVARDAGGDATDLNAEMATRPAMKCAPLGPLVAGACGGLDGQLGGQVGPEAGVPGPPALDVLEASFQETPDMLVVRVAVAALNGDFDGAVEAERGRGATWGVCWGDPEEGRQCASLAATPAGQAVALEATFTWWSGACNDWWYCSWAIAHDVAFGQPAFVTLHVPRGLLPHREAGDALALPRIVSERLELPPDRPSWALAGPLAAGGSVESPWMRHHADQSPFGEGFAFVTPVHPPAGSATVVHEGPADAAVPNGTDLEIQWLVLSEDGHALTILVELARVDEAPADHALGLVVGTPEGRVVEAGYEARGGTRTPYATACTDASCSFVVEPPFTFQVEPGSPGRVRFVFERSGLGSPAAGEALTLAVATTSRHGQGAALPEGPASGAATMGHDGDTSGVAPPFWLALDTAA